MKSIIFAVVLVGLQTSHAETDCAKCIQPRYPPFGSGRIFYLPHCVEDKTYNFCEAVCAGLKVGKENKGFCSGCDRNCSAVFKPVCSEDQTILYPNSCHAQCAEVQYVDCKGLNTIIPGKSPLPPSHLLPFRLQNFQGVDTAKEDDDI